MVLLAVFVYLAVGASSAALLVRASAARPRPPAGGGQIQHVYEAAFLSGGPARVADAALAALHADGRLVIGGPGIVSVRHALAHDPVERAVFEQLAAAPTGALHTLRLAVMRHPAVQEIGDGLAARGLMTPPGQNRGLTVWGYTQGFLCLIGLPLSFGLTVLSFIQDDGPVDSGPPFVVLVLPVLIAGIVIGFGRARRRITKAGQHALRSYLVQYAQVYSAAHLVAAHGLRGVPDPALQAQLTTAARTPASRTDGYSSSYTASAAVWCAGSSPGSGCGSSSCGTGGGSSCGGSSGGSSCGGSSGGSSCGGSSGGSSCGGGGSSSS